MSVAAIGKRIRGVIRRRGLAGTITAIPDVIWRLSRLHISISRRSRHRQWQQVDEKWDHEHGIDTGGTISLSLLTGSGDTWQNGSPYQAVSPSDFDRVVGFVPASHEEITFIDVGSGKGRALILAAKYPFKRIVGIEFMPELHQIALKNVNSLGLADRIQPINVDALEYPLPAGPLVIFMYNPFNDKVMTPFIRRVEESLRAMPRPIWILYVNSMHASLWDASELFHRVGVIDGSDQSVAWQSNGPSARQ